MVTNNVLWWCKSVRILCGLCCFKLWLKELRVTTEILRWRNSGPGFRYLNLPNMKINFLHLRHNGFFFLPFLFMPVVDLNLSLFFFLHYSFFYYFNLLLFFLLSYYNFIFIPLFSLWIFYLSPVFCFVVWCTWRPLWTHLLKFRNWRTESFSAPSVYRHTHTRRAHAVFQRPLKAFSWINGSWQKRKIIFTP